MGTRVSQATQLKLPAGTVTFLLSDIEGSTRLWEADVAAMSEAVAKCYALLDEAICRHGGVRPVEQGEGDSLVGAFSRPSDAVAAALAAQRSLLSQDWPGGIELRVRIALHAAEAQLRDEGNYFGVALSRCARLRAIAHGGQVLLSRAVHDLVVDGLPDGVTLVDLGVHRLRDLGRPEHVYACAHPDLPADFTELRSLDSLPNNLPDQLTSFVGREQELAAVREALTETRLLVLTGAGGCGKTRLALQSAAEALERFPDGVWWVELAPLADGALVGSALARSVGVIPLPGKSALEAATDHLARQRALVILDNCEHVLAAAADTAEALLKGCPELTLLATSRAPLGVGGESDWRVPSLSLPAERAPTPIEALAQSDAVRLFIERAAKVRPNFEVGAENAPAIAQICHDLDGIPLAIELAAARVRVLAPDQIAAGLGDRFRLLTGGARTAMPRQQTLRASVDWSYELLAEPERVLFRRLSTFVGGFTLDAAEQVCGGDPLGPLEVLDLLTALVDSSLVVADEDHVAVRYRLLETVREYALDLERDQDDRPALRAAHLDFFLGLAETVAPQLDTAAQSEWLAVLDAEGPNLAAALDWAAPGDGERALRLCEALTSWWRLRGLFAAAEAGYGAVLAGADENPSPSRAGVLCGRAHLLSYAGDYEGAIATAQVALAAAEAIEDRSGMARALNVIGSIQMMPDPRGAYPGLERSIELARASGDSSCLGSALAHLAFAHVMCDEFDQTQQLLDEAVAVRGSPEFMAWRFFGMSYRRLVEGELEQARSLAEEAVDAAGQVGEPVSEGYGHASLGQVETAQGQPGAALARVKKSRRRVIAKGAGLAVPITEITLAGAHAALGELERSREILEALIETGVDFGYFLARALVQVGDVLRAQGETARAHERALEALEVSERVGSAAFSTAANELLGRLATGERRFAEAEELLHAALASRAELGLGLWLPQNLDALALVAAGLESHDEAARLLGATECSRAALGLVRWPPDEPQFTTLEQELRDAIGPEQYADARSAGASLALDEAIAWIRRSRGSRKRPAGGWESLTPTEAQVVELVAEGLTNPQIAKRMFVSRATVKVHLAHVFQKLDVHTRNELAAEAVRRSG